MPADSTFALTIPPEALRSIVEQVVSLTIARLDAVRATLPDKLAFGEAEAARLLSLRQHQLRDERLRGRITASVGPGRRVLYRREDLETYLMARRTDAEEQ